MLFQDSDNSKISIKKVEILREEEQILMQVPKSWLFDSLGSSDWHPCTMDALYSVFFRHPFRQKKWKWSKNGLHDSWESSGKTSLKSVARTLSYPSPERSRPCVSCRIQIKRAKCGGLIAFVRQIRYSNGVNIINAFHWFHVLSLSWALIIAAYRWQRWNCEKLIDWSIYKIHNELMLFTLGSLNRIMNSLWLGLASGFGPSDFVQSRSPGVHRWREAGEEPRLFASQLMRQPLPHQCVRARAGPLPCQLCQLAW